MQYIKRLCFVVLYLVVTIPYATSFYSITENSAGYEVSFEFPEVEISDSVVYATLQNGSVMNTLFSCVRMDGFASNTEFGDPGIVSSGFYLALENENITVSLSDIRTKTIRLNNKLFPTQYPKMYCESELPNYFLYNSEAYAKRNVPQAIVNIEQIFTYRAQKVARIGVSPLGYDPLTNELTVVTHCKAQFIMEKPQRVYNGGSKMFDQLMRLMFVNFQMNGSEAMLSQPYPAKEKYLVIASSTYKNSENLKKLIDFRKKKYDVELVSTADIGGTTKDSYRTYIRNKKPAFCVLVGTSDDFPSHSFAGGGPLGNVPTYVYYIAATTTGRPLHEIALGLLFVKSDDELANIVNKTITTELNIASIPKTFLAHGGNTQNMGTGFPADHCDKIVQEMANTYFKPKGYKIIEAYSMLTPKGKKEKDLEAINEGVHFMNYNGHGGETSWSFGWGTSDLASITNSKVFPFVLGCACLTGTFTSKSPCMGQAFVANKNGPCTYIGSAQPSSLGQHTLNKGYFDAIMGQGISKNGAAYVFGVNSTKLPDCVQAGASSMTTFIYTLMTWQYHHFGDPAVEILNASNTSIIPQKTSQVSEALTCAIAIQQGTIHCVVQGCTGSTITMKLFNLAGKLILSKTIVPLSADGSTVADKQPVHATLNDPMIPLNRGVYLLNIEQDKVTRVVNRIIY